MASYPSTLEQLLTSSHDILDDLQMDRSIDGTGYSRAFYPALKDRFTLKHVLTAGQWATLLSFYNANRTTPFDLVYRGDGTFAGVTYTNLLFEEAPRLIEVGAGKLSVEVRMSAR